MKKASSILFSIFLCLPFISNANQAMNEDVFNSVFGSEENFRKKVIKDREESPFRVYQDEAPDEIKYSGVSTLDTIHTAFKDDSFVYMGASYLYNKKVDNTFDIDEDFKFDSHKDLISSYNVKRPDILNKIKERARNKEHLKELLEEGEEFEFQLNALKHNS